METSPILIVYQNPREDDKTKHAIQILQERYGMDPFTTRQHLIGFGPAFFARGDTSRLMAILDVLKGNGIRAWISMVNPGGKQCARVKRTWLEGDGLGMTGYTDGDLHVRHGATVLAVITDKKNEIAGKMVYQWGIQSHKKQDLTAMITKRILHSSPRGVLYFKNPGENGWRCVGIQEFLNVDGKAPIKSLGELLSKLGQVASRLVVDPYFGVNRLPYAAHESGTAGMSLKRMGLYGLYLLPGMDELVDFATVADSPVSRETHEKRDTGLNDDLSPALPPVAVGALWRYSGFGFDIAMAILLFIVNISGFRLSSWFTSQWRLRAYQPVGIGCAAIDLALAALFVWRSLHHFRLQLMVLNTPTSRIRSLAAGMVEVVGRAIRNTNLVGPVSGRACVYYRVTRYRRSVDLRGRPRWRRISDLHTINSPFVLDDGTGRVVVVPEGAQIFCTEKITRSTPGSMMVSTEKVVEESIPEFAEVYCLGFTKAVYPGRRSIRQKVVERLRRLKADKQELMKYDLDHNGVIDQHEWELAKRDVEQQVLKEGLQGAGRPVAPVVMIGKPDIKGLPFVIAQGTPDRTAGRFGLAKVLNGIAAVVALALGTVLLLEFLF